MLKACKYCGKIHSSDYVCEKKPASNHMHNRDVDRFRNTQLWKSKRNYIKERDNYMCQACFNNLYGTLKRINQDDLSVHHIVPLISNFELRLEDNNLITLCGFHHELAERGAISQVQLKEIVSK